MEGIRPEDRAKTLTRKSKLKDPQPDSSHKLLESNNCISMQCILMAGFSVTGVYPFDRTAIRLPESDNKSFKPEVLPKSNGLAYLPHTVRENSIEEQIHLLL